MSNMKPPFVKQKALGVTEKIAPLTVPNEPTTRDKLQNIKTNPRLPESTVVELPSMFLPYTGAKISYRPYTWQEIDLISDMNTEADYAKIINLMAEGIFIRNYKNLEPLDLTHKDFLYIAFLRKLASLGSATNKFNVFFDVDNKPYGATFDASQIYFEDLELEALPINAHLSIGTLEFSPITMRKVLELNEANNINNEKYVLAAQCTNLDLDVAYDLICNVVTEDILILQEVDKLLYHGIRPVNVTYKEMITNPSFDKTKEITQDNYPELQVQKEVEINIGDPSYLILPFRGEENPYSNAISFG